jgi:hypothetical protein
MTVFPKCPLCGMDEAKAKHPFVARVRSRWFGFQHVRICTICAALARAVTNLEAV